MGLFDFIKELLGIDTTPEYMRRPGQPPSSADDRSYRWIPGDEPPDPDPPRPPEPAVPANKTLGLDADKFAPLTAKEALGETQSADWRSAYFDSLSVIPSENLPRIRVIDGTMVGLGLISSEELAKIHEIGREMEQFRDPYAQVEEAARRAVTQSRQARNRIKEDKKREAEERKTAHAEAVAHRRATDIVFLGRGVSKGLADRRANVEKLEANHLPMLATPTELAAAMSLTIPKLRWLAFHSEAPTLTHYVYFTVPKKGGGERRLAAPHKQLAHAQRWVLDNILDKLPLHDAAHGFVRGRSVVTNADVHVGSDVVINADLSDFFPTITFYRVEGLFRSFGYSPAVATILALLCTECPRDVVTYAGETYYAATGPRGLPQGACTSPAISNLICRKLDHRFTGIANRMGWRYTRYADDLTFSAHDNKRDQIAYMLARIRHIAEGEGFRVNQKKTRVQKRNSQQSVTGIVVNDKLSINRKTIRRLRAILHNAKRTGFAAQNRDDHPHFESWLRGMIAYVEMVMPEKGGELRAEFEALQ